MPIIDLAQAIGRVRLACLNSKLTFMLSGVQATQKRYSGPTPATYMYMRIYQAKWLIIIMNG